VTFLAAPVLMAQSGKIELTPTFSTMWGGTIETVYGKVVLEDGPQYGFIFDYTVQRELQLELYYSYLKSNATFSRYGYETVPADLENLNEDLVVNYIQVGALYQVPKGNVRPFFTFTAGTVIFSPSSSKYTDEWRAAITFGGGVKIFLSESIGLRVQGRLLLPFYVSGGGVWFGTGGASVGVSAGIPIVQGDLGIGLIIAI